MTRRTLTPLLCGGFFVLASATGSLAQDAAISTSRSNIKRPPALASQPTGTAGPAATRDGTGALQEVSTTRRGLHAVAPSPSAEAAQNAPVSTSRSNKKHGMSGTKETVGPAGFRVVPGANTR